MIRAQSRQKLVLRPLWQIILAVVAAISIPLTIIILNQNIDWRLGAAPTENPTEIVISNISDTSVTISFETKSQKTKSLVNFGTAENSLTNSSFDERRKYDSNAPEDYKLHYHKLVNLKQNTDYFFSITVGDQNYSNASYKFKTLSSSALQVPAPLNGTVNGGNFEEGFMYIHMKSDTERSSVISELLPQNGNFAISLSSAVDKTGNTFLSTHQNPEVYIFVNGADKGKGAIKTTKDATNISIDLNTQNTAEFNPQTIENELNGESTPTPPPTEQPSVTPEITPTATPTADIDETSKKLLYETFDIEGKALITPKNIALGNPATTSFTVSWTTQVPVKGAVAYGINKDPEVLTYDKRDSTSNQIERYTHIVDIADSNLKTGDIINLIIVSDEQEFINGNEYFKYKVPDIEAAPNPTSMEGKIILDNADESKKDFVILGKTPESSWIISNVNETLNFTLPIGALVDRELSDPVSLAENDNISIEVFGETNSYELTTQQYIAEEITEITVDPGVTIEDIDSGAQIPPGGKINGTAKPNSNVSIKLGDAPAVTVKANASGEWSYTISSDAKEGNQILTISESGSEISLEVTIQLDELPVTNPTPTPGASTRVSPTPSATPTGNLADTALNETQLGYFYGLIVLLVGIYLLRIADKKHR